MTQSTFEVNTNIIKSALNQAGSDSKNTETRIVSCANTEAGTTGTTPEKPTYLSPIFENFPKELTDLPQWLVWKAEYDPEKKKWKKRPYSPVTGYGKWKDPANWGTFEDAKKAYQHGDYNGVSFVLCSENNMIGIDLDSILTPEKDFSDPDAKHIFETLSSYTDISPSGNGIRTFCFADIPKDHRKRGRDKSTFELYSDGKVLTMTGHILNGNQTVENRQNELEKVYNMYFKIDTPKPPAYVSEPADLSDISDHELLDKMLSSNDEKLKSLFRGDKCGFDDSGADFSLCLKLAFWTGKDAQRMDALFRQSGLYREKWDEKNHFPGGRTYGQGTIDNAIAKCTEVYTPQKKRAGTTTTRSKSKADPEIPDNFKEELLKKIGEDKNSVYSDEITKIICKIKEIDPVRYRQIRDLLKKQKVSITEYEKHLRDAGKELSKELKKQEKFNEIEKISSQKNTLILKNGNLPEEVEYCQAVLRDNEIIFERGNALYRIIKVKESKSKDKKVSRDEDSYIIELVNPAWLKLELSKNIKFVKIKMTHQGPISEPANCSFDIVNSICANNGAWDMPYLAGIQNAPVITPEGKIYGRKAGFDHDTELLFTRDFGLPIPEKPTKEEIEQARAVIHEIIREYRFESDIDYSVAFSAILSSVVRRMIPTCPFFAIDSTKAGSGKTKLADCISIIASGNSPATLNVPPFDDKESEKRYDSILLNGDPVILIDNIENAIKSDRLCTIATQTQVTARILGQSKVVTVPSNSLWLLTGNNIQFRGDITRRVLKSRINQGVENPEELSFDKDPVQYTIDHRDEIIQSIIVILKAFLNSDDKPAVKPMGSFEVWSNFIRRAVIWMGMSDPCLSKQIIQADDDEKNKISGLLDILYDVFQDKEFIVKDMIGTTDEDLKSILDADFKVKGEVNSRKIGNFLSKNNGRIENGLCLERTGEHRTGVAIWRVRITQHGKHTEENDSETSAGLAELPKNITQQMQTTVTTDGKYEMLGYAGLDLPPEDDLSEKKETEVDKEGFSFFQNTEKGDRDLTQHNPANDINGIENQDVNSAGLAKNVTLHNPATQQMDNFDKENSQNSESESLSCEQCRAFGTQDGVNRCFNRVMFEHKSGGSVPITDITKTCPDFRFNTDLVN